MAEECALLSLPSEIRVLIYQYLFNLDLWKINRVAGAYDYPAGSCDLNLLNGFIHTRRNYSDTKFRHFTAILRTNRLLYTEALPVLFEQTIFHLRISDEKYNRRFRESAAPEACAFLPRVKQISINADVRLYRALLELPDTLNRLFDLMTCAPEKTIVQFKLTSGSLSEYTPMVLLAEEEESFVFPDEEVWVEFLRKMGELKKRCRFLITTPYVRSNVQERMAQVVRTVDGGKWTVPYVLFEGT